MTKKYRNLRKGEKIKKKLSIWKHEMEGKKTKRNERE